MEVQLFYHLFVEKVTVLYPAWIINELKQKQTHINEALRTKLYKTIYTNIFKF